MILALHKNARTTPAIRAEIAASSESVAVLAARYGVSEGTIRRWRDAGAERVYLQVLDLEDLEHLDLIAREVAPAV